MHHSRATVVLTRPQGKNQALQLRFEQAGLRVATLPALTLQPIAVTDPVPDPATFDLIFFVSGFAVDRFFDLLAEQGMRWPQGQRAGCVGPGTVQALQHQGVAQQQILCPVGDQPYDSSGFLARLKASAVFACLSSVLIVCGTTGNPWLARQLQELSLQVKRLPLYRRDARQWDRQQQRQMSSLLADPMEKKYVVLTSPQGIEAFVDNLATAQIDPDPLAESTTFVVTHEGQVDSLKHAWQQKLPAGNAGTLRIVRALPQEDAIFHIVTISD
ncbi:uroporphyrinogen-III synthase [Advenella sp. FME57]|uniref:uroporphyrinogen-III synthase n=1 Tax=Advenella sp. FME57 TaxID=2742604 RepID=UPI0018671DDB